MSFQKLTSKLKSAKLRSSDRIWYGRWVDAYRHYCRVGPNDPIPVSRESVIGFLRQQKSSGKKAWQRLQMVKAVQFYQTAVLGSPSPPLDDVRDKLAEFVANTRLGRRRRAGRSTWPGRSIPMNRNRSSNSADGSGCWAGSTARKRHMSNGRSNSSSATASRPSRS